MDKHSSKNKKIYASEFIVIPLILFISIMLLIAAVIYPNASIALSIAKSVIVDEDMTALPGKLPNLLISAATVENEQIIDVRDVGEIIYPKFAEKYAELTAETAGMIDLPVYFGDDDFILKKGIGHYKGSDFPGEGGKIIYVGHRETFFKNLGKLKIADKIVIKTMYGVFTYKVSDIKIIKAEDNSILASDNTKETLLMYTCYPFDTIGYKPERYVVFADLINGPKLKKWGDD